MWVASSSLFPAVAIYTLWKQKPFGYTFPYCLQVNCSKQQYVYNWRRALVSFNQRRRLSTTRFWLRKYFFWFFIISRWSKFMHQIRMQHVAPNKTNTLSIGNWYLSKFFCIRGTFHALWKPLWDWNPESRAPNKSRRRSSERQTSREKRVEIESSWVKSELSGN